MNDKAEVRILEAVIDPKWEVLHPHSLPGVILRLTHPRHGVLDFLIPSEEAVKLAAVLDRAPPRTSG